MGFWESENEADKYMGGTTMETNSEILSKG